MTDRYERIRAALAKGPTPGPWRFAHTNSGMFVKSERLAGYFVEVRHCCTAQDVEADAHLIAACDPDTIRELLDERDQLAADLETAESDALEQARLLGMSGEREAALLTKLEAAEKERDTLRSLVVMRFDHDYPPQFTQGYEMDEFAEPVTAEHCQWFVAEIERLRADYSTLQAKIERMEKRLRLILEEPENTMSNSKAMREMLRQARLALEESK